MTLDRPVTVPDFTSCKTIREAREMVVNALKEVGIERVEVRREADLVIEHVTRLTATERIVALDEAITEAAKVELKEIVARRLTREPLQYCLGYGWFMGKRMVVQPGVFIPRTDTETLCELVLARLKAMGPLAEMRVLEIGVGSGCIGVSLLTALENLQVVGIDISQDALDVARLNARAYDVSNRLTLSKCDFRDFTLSGFHAIVSNPPYIPQAIYETLEPEVLNFEPKAALVGWDSDGLGFYREFGKFALPKLIVPHGFAAVEVGDEEADEVTKIMRTSGMNKIESVNDVNGLPRVVVASVA